MKDSVDFSHLILGFSSAALTYMGYSLSKEAPTPKKNLPLAKQNIDIINLLKEKTKGNLLPDEDTLISSVLTDLRIKYAEAQKNTSQP